ncbi:MAG: hypothetical protein ACON4O_01690 [Lentimonas sp.]
MKRLLLLALFIIGSVAASGESEFRIMTNKDGQTIEAKVVSHDGTRVTIETRNGTTYENVNISIFSVSDRIYFKEWAAAAQAAKDDAELKFDSKIKMFVKSSRDNDLNDKGDPDNREVEYEPAITFENEDKDLSFKDVRGTLVFIGESVLEKKEFHILYKENFTVTIPRGERVKWTGTPFKNIYDDFAANGSAFGAEYEGYLIVLYDKRDKAVITKASKTKWGRYHERILKANISLGHIDNFSRTVPKSTY